MVDWAFALVVIWHALLLLLLLVYASRSRDRVGQLIAFDAASLVLASALVVLAAHRQEVGFLDIALVLVMLVFTQTLAAVRLLRARRIEE